MAKTTQVLLVGTSTAAAGTAVCRAQTKLTVMWFGFLTGGGIVELNKFILHKYHLPQQICRWSSTK